MRHFVFVSILIGAVLAAPVSRAADPDFARRGAYVGLGASRGFNFFDDAFQDAVFSDSVHVNDTWGLNARAGYRFAKWFSTELEYEWLDRFQAHSGSFDIAEVTTHTVTVNVRFTAPLGRIQPYFLMGFGGAFFDLHNQSFLDVHSDDAVPCGKLGAGFDFYVTPNLVLNLGAEGMLNDAEVRSHFTGGDANGLEYVALQFGFGYRF